MHSHWMTHYSDRAPEAVGFSGNGGAKHGQGGSCNEGTLEQLYCPLMSVWSKSKQKISNYLNHFVESVM